MIDLDDMLAAPSAPAQSSGLGGINMGGMQSQPDNNFGFGNDAGNDEGEEQPDWATAGMFDSPASHALDFAKPELLEVLQQN